MDAVARLEQARLLVDVEACFAIEDEREALAELAVAADRVAGVVGRDESGERRARPAGAQGHILLARVGGDPHAVGVAGAADRTPGGVSSGKKAVISVPSEAAITASAASEGVAPPVSICDR